MLTPEQIRQYQQQYQIDPSKVRSLDTKPTVNTDFNSWKSGMMSTPKPAESYDLPEEKGFIRSTAEDIVRPTAEVGVGLYNATKSTKKLLSSGIAKLLGEDEASQRLINEADQERTESRNLPFVGVTKPAITGGETTGQVAKKAIGYGADIGSTLSGAGATGKMTNLGLKGAVKEGLKVGVKTGALAGAESGLGKSLKENQSVLQTGLNTLGGTVVGAGTGAVAGALLPLVSKVAMGALNKIPFVKKNVPIEYASTKLPNPRVDLGESIGGLAEGIQTRVIKPTKRDLNSGFDIKNVFKHDVAGNLGDSLNKTQQKIKQFSTQLGDSIAEKGDEKILSFADAVKSLEEKYKTKEGSFKLLGKTKQYKKALQDIRSELDEILPDWKTSKVNLLDAVHAKRAAGLKSAFEHDPMKPQNTPTEDVWTDLYMALKNQTENVGSKEFASANKALSELIPIEQALIRRIPVEQRNNLLSLPDIISLTMSTVDPRALSVGLANRALKSGTVANFLGNVSKKILTK